MGNICLALSYEKIREAWGIYNEVALETEGRELQVGEGVAVMRPTFLADTYEEAVSAVRTTSTRSENGPSTTPARSAPRWPSSTRWPTRTTP